jgi:branched-chain amino acid transport system ATP-binding protein
MDLPSHPHPEPDRRSESKDPGRSPVLETRDLTIRFGGQVAVDHVSCGFARGTLTAIVGPNGAGKTTYFNLISGQLRPSEGEVLLDGAAVTGLGAAARTRRGIGRAFQLTNLFPNLSVHENVRLAVQARAGIGLDIFRMASRDRDLAAKADAFLDRVRLGERAGAPAASLPHGDQRKLEIAILLALEPAIFMFDEPTAGMSVDEVPVILDLIEAIRQSREHTILLVEHKMEVVRRLADRVIVLHNGALVADGEPEAVVASPIVQEAYLGIKAGAPP